MQITGATSAGDIAATAVAALLLAVLYLAPVIVAIIYRSGNLLAIVLIDILLGWTVIGWIVAWVLFATGRRDAQPQPLNWGNQVPQHTGAFGLSSDGMFWWDGIAWRDTRAAAPPSAPRSADGFWWWDGRQWRPVPPPPPH